MICIYAQRTENCTEWYRREPTLSAHLRRHFAIPSLHSPAFEDSCASLEAFGMCTLSRNDGWREVLPSVYWTALNLRTFMSWQSCDGDTNPGSHERNQSPRFEKKKQKQTKPRPRTALPSNSHPKWELHNTFVDCLKQTPLISPFDTLTWDLNIPHSCEAKSRNQ